MLKKLFNHLMLLSFVPSGILVHAAASEVDPVKLLEKAEFIRNPPESYQTKVVLSDTDKGKSSTHVYESFVHGRDKALVKFIEPAEDAGQRVLMVADDMWIYLPSTAKAIRISPKQKLTGNAAYGDVVRLSFVSNYTAKFLRKDKYKDKDAAVLDLTAIDGKPVTYDKIEYWIDIKTNRPLKALYKTVTDKILRESEFEQYEPVFGVERPAKFILTDYINKNHVTTMVFSNPKKQNFSDLMFQKQNLGRE